MSDLQRFAAEMLEAATGGYSAAAAHRLVVSRPTATGRYGLAALQSWRAFMTQTLMELAAAVRFDCPELFAADVRWQQSAFAERGADAEDLTAALDALRSTLADELPDNARAAVMRFADAGIGALSQRPQTLASRLDPPDPSARLALRYIVACLEGHAETITTFLDEARRTLSDAEIYLRILLPAQEEIGRMWHAGEIGIAEEHLVSETTRRLTARLRADLPPGAAGKTVLTAAVAGNLHDIGIRAVSDFFQAAGWRCIALGANVPASEIAQAASEFEVEIAALSATLSTQLAVLEESIAALHRLERGVKVLIGGRAVDKVPELWRRLGADGYAASPQAALRVATELLTDAGPTV